MRFLAVPLLVSLGLAITFAGPSEGASIPGARVVASTTPLATRVKSPCPLPLVWSPSRGRCVVLHAIGRHKHQSDISKSLKKFGPKALLSRNFPEKSWITCNVAYCQEWGGFIGGYRVCRRWVTK
jgi:hypothetical protein